jgi:hypothetical protein
VTPLIGNHVTPPRILNYDPPRSPRVMIRIEEEPVKTSFAFAVALFWTAFAPQGAAQEQQSFKTILGKGYEIKGVTFARGEATDNREIFVVTLQKEKSVAVCYFAAANWINLSPASLEDSKRCDVR